MSRPMMRIRLAMAHRTASPIDIVLALTAGTFFLVGLLHLVARLFAAL